MSDEALRVDSLRSTKVLPNTSLPEVFHVERAKLIEKYGPPDIERLITRNGVDAFVSLRWSDGYCTRIYLPLPTTGEQNT